MRDRVLHHIDGIEARLIAGAHEEILKRVEDGTFAVFPAVLEQYNSQPVAHWHAMRDYHRSLFRSAMIKAMARGLDVIDGENFRVHRRYADGTPLVGQDENVFEELTQAWKRYTTGVHMLVAVETAWEKEAAKMKVAEAVAEKEKEGEGETDQPEGGDVDRVEF